MTTSQATTPPSLNLSLDGNLAGMESIPDVDLDALLDTVVSNSVVGDNPVDTDTEPIPSNDTETVKREVLQDLNELTRNKPTGENYLSVPQLLKLGFTRKDVDEHLTDITEDENWAGIVREDAQALYAYKHGHIRNPARYYSVAEVESALTNKAVTDKLAKTKDRRAKKQAKDGQDGQGLTAQALASALADPTLVGWLTKTKDRRAKLSKDKQRLISQAVASVIAIENPVVKQDGKVSLDRVLNKAVSDWNKLYSQIIPEELHDVVEKFNQQVLVPSEKLPTPLSTHTPKTDAQMWNRIHVVTTRAIRDDLTNYKMVSSTFAKHPANDTTIPILRIKTAKVIRDTYPQLSKATQYVFLTFDTSAWEGLTKQNVHQQKLPATTLQRLHDLKVSK